MNFTVSKRIALSFALVLIFLLLIGWVGFSNSRRLTETAERVTHTHSVLAGMEELMTHLQDVESGSRGYVITGDPSYLDPFHEGVASLSRKLSELRTETSDNPAQQQRFKTLEPLIARRVAHSTETVRLRREQGAEAGQASVSSGLGKSLMDDIRKVITEIEQEERTLLRQREETSRASVREAQGIMTLATFVAVLGAIGAGFVLARSVTHPVAQLGEAARRIGQGELHYRATAGPRDELGALATAFNQMAEKLQANHAELSDQNWSKTNQAAIVRMIQGRRELDSVGRDLLSQVVPLVNAACGVVYLNETTGGPPALRALASYGEPSSPGSFGEGQGLPGQCLRDHQRIHLTSVPTGYLKVRSGVGSAEPASLLLVPVLFEEKVLAVIELATFGTFTPRHLAFLDQLSDILGPAFAAILASARTETLLQKAQELSHELQVQQEELETSNQSLAQKNQELRASEEELQQSGEELKSANEELEEKARLLEQQNREVERARRHLEAQAVELSRTSRYKSEFLANMSHELRTPLNSLLILSRMLADNGDGNLTPKQVEYARTVHHSGQDLLELINDILDLSKIESGTVTPESETVPFDRITALADQMFRHLAETKGVPFTIERGEPLPRTIQTDERRLNQILKNLLANAFKFTERGSVTLSISPATDGWGEHPVLDRAGSVIAFSVRDTGIGIPREKLDVIFEAFQQADGTTARKYGGTGLGLSISRGLARMLGGALRVDSEPGNGSTFTLFLPAVFVPAAAATTAESGASAELQGRRLNQPVATLGTRTEAWELRQARAAQPAPALAVSAEPALPPGTGSGTLTDSEGQPIEDDRASIQRGDHTLLVIEDDLEFARVVLELAHERGFKVIVAPVAVEGLELARHYRPSAISLDLRLPDADGWVVLDRLKHDPATSHIPVHIISATDDEQRGLRHGALSFLQKPVSKESLQQALDKMQQFVRTGVRQLLLVEDDARLRATLLSLIGNGDVETTVASSGEEALTALGKKHFDCMVLDLSLPGMNGFQVLEKLRADPAIANVPVVVYTGRDLTVEEQAELERLSEAVILKGTRSPERLLDETALFLHRVQSKLPDAQRKMIERIRASDPLLAGKQLLVVDDDMRNIFTLTALLERHKMVVQYVQSGQAALDLLEKTPGIDAVLMDIMMPEMDGYETMRRIRANAPFARLPVIALTAKAMKGDREKCLEAGASDYITKPVDIDQLLSLLRVWLYR